MKIMRMVVSVPLIVVGMGFLALGYVVAGDDVFDEVVRI